MTTVRKYHLRCDGWGENRSDCEFQLGERPTARWDLYPKVDPYGGNTVAEERARAVKADWSREGRKDFCPPCTERRKAAE